jgi:hypothetical protein
VTVSEVGLELSAKLPAAAPVPVRVTVWGLPAALSVMVTDPVAAPEEVGVKVTLIVQLPPALTLVPQVFVSPKPALGTMLVMERAAVPVLDRVTVCAALVVLRS